jgi:membrane associated rhomboid family serine protease
LLPLRDDIPTYRTPYLTMGIIGLNLAVFLYQAWLSPQREEMLIYDLGLIPAWLTGLAPHAPPPDFLPRPLTLVTSMFLHADILHLGGNMLYLWIFGNNVEDALGPWRYALFYLLGGVLAGLAHVAAAPGSPVPTIGASGAVAANLGAYFLLHPRAKVSVLLWLFVFVQVVRVPAVVLLGLWFFLQVLGLGGAGVANVAWTAHVGGFVAGLALVRLFLPRPRSLF